MLEVLELLEDEAMAKASKPPPPEERVTLLNFKGSLDERAALEEIRKETGVSLTEMARRGMAMWIISRGLEPPEGWAGK